MEPSEQRTEIVLSIEQAQIFDIQDQNRNLLAAGELQLIYVINQNIHILTIGDFSYSLSNELIVLRSDKNKYAFPSNDGYIELEFSNLTDEMEIEVFEIFLSQHTTFTNIQNISDPSQIVFSEPVVRDEGHQDVIDESPRNQDNGKNVKAIIEEGASKIKSEIIRGAAIASEGIKKGGQYLKNKIGPDKIEEYKMKAQIAMFMAKVVANRAVNVASQATQNIISNISNSGVVQNIERSESYQSASEIGRSGITAANTIYEGLENALLILRDAGSTVVNDLRNNRQEQIVIQEEEKQE